jgi:hypothetical protein
LSKTVKDELRKKHRVDEYFYPKVDMDVDLPKGLQGEIEKTILLLENNGFPATSENVYQIMTLKKNLITKYSSGTAEKQVLEDYATLLKQKQPIGSVGPIDYYIVVGIVAILMYTFGKFGGSFLEEAGKITAKKFLKKNETKKQLQKELKIDQKEYNLFANQIIIIIDKKPSDISEILNTLEKTRKNSTVRRKSN